MNNKSIHIVFAAGNELTLQAEESADRKVTYDYSFGQGGWLNVTRLDWTLADEVVQGDGRWEVKRTIVGYYSPNDLKKVVPQP